MTEMVLPWPGASKACNLTWNSVHWDHVKSKVYRLQMRIGKAFREGKHGKAQALQWILTHSFNAKLLAVIQSLVIDAPPFYPADVATRQISRNLYLMHKPLDRF